MQTHLLKFDPPYKFIFDMKHGRVGKLIAALLRPSDVEKDMEGSCTVAVPIVDLARTWDDTDLDKCTVLCDEFNPTISFEKYIDCIYSADKRAWFPNGLFSVFRLGNDLNYYGIRVKFPGEGEKEGDHEVELQTKLLLGVEEGVYWVENSFSLCAFYFGGSYESLEKLRYAIIGRRNDYYRSFPQKRFRIFFVTDNADFQGMIDDINNTPYVRDERFG